MKRERGFIATPVLVCDDLVEEKGEGEQASKVTIISRKTLKLAENPYKCCSTPRNFYQAYNFFFQ